MKSLTFKEFRQKSLLFIEIIGRRVIAMSTMLTEVLWPCRWPYVGQQFKTYPVTCNIDSPFQRVVLPLTSDLQKVIWQFYQPNVTWVIGWMKSIRCNQTSSSWLAGLLRALSYCRCSIGPCGWQVSPPKVVASRWVSFRGIRSVGIMCVLHLYVMSPFRK